LNEDMARYFPPPEVLDFIELMRSPAFPTFPHTGMKFTEIRVKVKQKRAINTGVL
jgi:hypothetical protein